MFVSNCKLEISNYPNSLNVRKYDGNTWAPKARPALMASQSSPNRILESETQIKYSYNSIPGHIKKCIYAIPSNFTILSVGFLLIE